MFKLVFSLGLAIGSCALVVACASSSTTPTATSALPGPLVTPASAAASPSAAVSPAASPSTNAATTIQMTDALRFDPVSLTVPRGTTVTWRNTSQTMHTVTDDPSKAANPSDALLPSGAQPWDSGTIDPDRTFSHTFDVPGTYKYFCQPHEAAGMLGTIVVTP